MTHDTNRLVVLGAGGRTGRLILECAHRQNHPAVAVVRSPERAGLATRAGLDVVAADARDADSLRRALRPGDVIVSAVGPAGRKSHGLYTSVAEAVVTATAGLGSLDSLASPPAVSVPTTLTIPGGIGGFSSP